VVFVPLFIITFILMRIDLVFHHLRKDEETYTPPAEKKPAKEESDTS
jgi:hypothetical protein